MTTRGVEPFYRRREDGDTRLLVALNERVENIQEILNAVQNNQGRNPCDTHELRLKNLEKVMWVAMSAIVLLIGKLVYTMVVR